MSQPWSAVAGRMMRPSSSTNRRPESSCSSVTAFVTPSVTSANGASTVVGASQYTVQLSGSTIYVNPLNALPLRNVPVIAPDMKLDAEEIDPTFVAEAIKALKASDVEAVAVCFLHADLDPTHEAAVAAVKTCTFTPGERNGEPVPTLVPLFKYTFLPPDAD